MFDSGEPFGLPRGTVRGIIALTFTGLVAWSFVALGTVSPELLAIAGPYLGFYFAGRQAANATEEAAEEPLDPPFVGEDPA